jgi:hypothetical protein
MAQNADYLDGPFGLCRSSALELSAFHTPCGRLGLGPQPPRKNFKLRPGSKGDRATPKSSSKSKYYSQDAAQNA